MGNALTACSAALAAETLLDQNADIHAPYACTHDEVTTSWQVPDILLSITDSGKG